MTLHLSVEEHAKVLDGCRFCGMCTHACTVANATHNDANSPRGKGRLLYALHTGMLEFTPRVVELLYQDTNCKLCQAWCVPGLDPGATLRAARFDVVAQEKAPPLALTVSRAVAEHGNPYGEPASSQVELDAGAVGKKDAEVLYFLDSHIAYQEPQVAQATWRILQHVGIEPALLPELVDAGEVLLELGFLEQARQQAQKTLKALRASGAEMILFSSADAYHMVAREYPETLGLSTEGLTLRHISQLLAELVDAGSLQCQPLETRVAYHDPCRLGRGMEVYDAPRTVLTAIPGLTLVEPPWTRDKAVCCGAGGGMSFSNPDITAEAARQAAHMLNLPRPELIVTGCARCKSYLAPALPDTEVLELAEFVARVL
jgi:Fe-S oxidoreductase